MTANSVLTEYELGILSNLALEEAGHNLEKAQTAFEHMQNAYRRELKLWLYSNRRNKFDDLLEGAGFPKRFSGLPLWVRNRIDATDETLPSPIIYRKLKDTCPNMKEWACEVLAAIILCPKTAFVEACSPRYRPTAQKLAELFDVESWVILFRSAILGEYGN